MNASSKNQSAWRNALSDVVRQGQLALAPLVAPLMPERYYELYRRSLADTSEALDVLKGLPAGTVTLGYSPLFLNVSDTSHAAQNIWDALAQSARILVYGPVGSGKSTLLRWIAHEFAARSDNDFRAFVSKLTFKLFGHGTDDLLPLWLDLAAFNQGASSLEQVLLAGLAHHHLPGAQEYLQKRLKAGQCILLLDNLEHLIAPERRAVLEEALVNYPGNIWIVTTRLMPEPLMLPGFMAVRLAGIASADIPGYLGFYLNSQPASVSSLLAACERSRGLVQLAGLPLMLAAMSRALLRDAIRGVRLTTLCDACLEVLLEEWSAKAGYAVRYPLPERSRLLEALAYQVGAHARASLSRDELLQFMQEQLPSDQRGTADDSLDELTRRTGLLNPITPGSQDYRFVAPLLQSYLAARAVVSAQKAEALVPLAGDPSWRDTIVLTAALLPDASPFLQRLEASLPEQPDKWLLLAGCLAELGDRDEATRARVSDHLFAFLEEERPELWSQAIVGIAGIRREPVREHFTGLIRHVDPEMRRRAALALGRLHQEWAIPSLGAAISDPEPRVRQQAVWALGYIPSQSALSVLPRALHSPHQGVCEAAARSMALLGRTPELLRPIVSDLVIALGDENEKVVRLAERAVFEIGPAAMPQLTTALNDSRLRQDQRGHVAKALGRLGDERVLPILIDAIVSSSSDDLQGYIDAVASIGAHAVPTLIASLQGKDIATGASLVAALVQIGAPAVGPLIEAIAGSAPEIRNSAVRALEQIGAPAVEPLAFSLLHDMHYEVRRSALEILGHIGESYVVSALISALKDSDAGVCMNAVRYLGDLRDATATEPLVTVLQSDVPLALRRATVTSLGAIGDAQAIPALLHALDDRALREVASSALFGLGGPVVEPLIKLIHTPEANSDTREAAWDILSRLGARAHPEDQTPLALASIYAGLHDQSLSLEKKLSLTEHMTWWQYGTEIHQSLATANNLLSSHTLEEISESAPTLAWLTEPGEWLRPHIKRILWGFRDVVENIKLFRTLTKRDSQRDALLSSIDRLEALHQRTDTDAVSFEHAFLEKVFIQWRAVIHDAIKQLRGRAALNIQLLTQNLPLRQGQVITTAVFSLFNEGDSAARNLSVLLRSADVQGVQIAGEERRALDPLGIGEERQVEFSIAPRGMHQAQLAFEVHYDDDEREDNAQPFSCHIDFVEAPSVFMPIKSSPYIAGIPVKTPEMFFGRQDVFAWVRDNISGTHQDNVLVLYGERRMGKTSVLYQLQRNPPTPHHICLLFDLQIYSYINTAHDLFFELATAIAFRLRQQGLTIADPDWDQYHTNPYHAFLDFCTGLESSLGDWRILVMLDEFGVLMAKVRDNVLDTSIFDFLRGVIQRTNCISFLFTGAYEVRRMQQDYGSFLFNIAKVHKISYLTPGEATELIEKPIEGLLAYHPLVLRKILSVTACHPYFVQYVCDGLVQHARSARKNYVELMDLDYVIKDVVRDATGNIENSIYMHLGNNEKLILATLANVTDDVRVFVPLSDMMTLLDRRQQAIPREEATQALKALAERDLVTEMRIGQQLHYSFRMGLVRMWLRQNEILLRLSQERAG